MKTEDDRSGKVVQCICQNQLFTLLQVNRSQNRLDWINVFSIFGLRTNYVLSNDGNKVVPFERLRKLKVIFFELAKFE